PELSLCGFLFRCFRTTEEIHQIASCARQRWHVPFQTDRRVRRVPRLGVDVLRALVLTPGRYPCSVRQKRAVALGVRHYTTLGELQIHRLTSRCWAGRQGEHKIEAATKAHPKVSLCLQGQFPCR